VQKILIVLFATFLFPACQRSDQFVIDGTLTNSLSPTIFLEKLEVNRTVPFDSAKIDRNGRFILRGEVSYPSFFLLKLNEQKFITLLLDSAERVVFSADFINFTKDYSIEGSPGSRQVQQLNQQLSQTQMGIDSLESLLQIGRRDGVSQGKILDWQQEMQTLYREHQEYVNNFIGENPFSMASLMAIYQKFKNGEYIVQNLQTIKVAASALHALYPQSEHVVTLYQDARNMMETVRNEKIREFIREKGVNSPELVLPNPLGKEIALSSFRGKYVLLHFWSVYDRDSRIQNPVLRENYLKFNPRGFEIYQVCVDTSKNDWLDVLKADQLTWTQVNDLQGCNTALMNYNIRSVPSNYLLDKEGVIVARDLKGPALYAKLNEILN